MFEFNTTDDYVRFYADVQDAIGDYKQDKSPFDQFYKRTAPKRPINETRFEEVSRFIFYETNSSESVFIEASWSDVDGEVFHDDDIDSWVVHVPGVGYAVEAEGTQNHFPEHISLWMFYDTDRYKTDTEFTSANKTDVLLQIQCKRNMNIRPL